MEINYFVLMPEILLCLVGLLVMVAAPVLADDKQRMLGLFALTGVGLALISIVIHWDYWGTGFFEMVFQDSLTQFARLLFLLSGASIIILSREYLESEGLKFGEFYALVLFSTAGMALMASSADLIMTFLGVEVLSISTYVLAGFRRSSESAEAAWKYFILGAFSTAFMLYGIALVYGATGSTKYPAVAEAIQSGGPSNLLLIGLGLILVGFGFKAALAPFHIWTPDVYEGAPIPITAHLAVASKAAAFVALLRILMQVFPSIAGSWQMLIWLSAVITMLLGNIVALSQSNIKRMLAYSSIAHAGYLLVGVTAANQVGTGAVLFYLACYAFMSLGAFAVIQILARRGEKHVNLSDFTGIGYRYPFLTISLSIFLISMAGIPATAGFMGKLFLFTAAVKSRLYWLVILGLIASAIGVYYYLRVIVLMFMREPTAAAESIEIPLGPRLLIGLMVVGTFYLGLFPGSVLTLVSQGRLF